MMRDEVTKEDLQIFRIQLLDDLKRILNPIVKEHKAEWLRSKEVRAILHVSLATLQNLRIKGTLNPTKINGSWYYSFLEIDTLFKEGAQ